MSSIKDLITKAKNFDADDVTYKPPVQSGNIRRIYCQLNGHPINLQFPLMKTWGVNERIDDNSGKVSYDLNLRFGTDNKSVVKFKDNLKKFEEKILNDAVENSKQWFGRKMKKEVAEAMMYPILKYPNLKDGSGEPDYSREPTLKLKLQYWEEEFKVEIFGMDNETKKYTKPLFIPSIKENSPQGDKTPVDFIEKNSHIKGLLECQGIWYAGGRFGVTWKLNQAGVRPPMYITGSGKSHLLDDSDDEEEEERLKKMDEINAVKNNLEDKNEFNSMVDDSDNETVQEDEEEENNEVVAEVEEEKQEEKKPKKKKRTVRRKKKTVG